MLRPFVIALDFQGALTEDETFEFLAPFDLQLLHASAVASNDSDATLAIGTAASAAAYMAATAIGDSGTPVAFDRDDFVDDQYPHIPKDTNVLITIDFDGASGTPGEDVNLLITFVEG